jgi:hypothetical protein
LINFFAPLLPYRKGTTLPDAPQTFRSNFISLAYVPQTTAQTTIADPMPSKSAELKVTAQPGCPVNDELCGFSEGMTVVIFDDTGASDTFTITNVQTAVLQLQQRDQNLSKAYGTGSYIAQVRTASYWHDTTTNQLKHYDGATTDVPVADNVVDFKVRWFGDPDPPRAPKPPFGTANCLYHADGTQKLPTLTATTGSLVELTTVATDGTVTSPLLTTGETCGTATNAFDADLYRVRKLEVRFRVQVADAALRGADTTLFKKPGASKGGATYVPDFEVRFEVVPRNLNLGR